MSCMVAGPVARHGDPKKPCRNRRNKRPPRLSTSAVGTDRMTNRANVTMYGTLRPMMGISDMGEKMRGPIPYPSTKRARPRDALNS